MGSLPSSWTKTGKVVPVFAGAKIVEYLKNQKNATADEIATDLNYNPGTVLQTVSYLIKAKLAKVDGKGKDRKVSLTRKAKRRKPKPAEKSSVETITEEDVGKVSDVLGKVEVD